MITEDYVNFETAKLLKEKGFDEKCMSYYGHGEFHLGHMKYMKSNTDRDGVAFNGVPYDAYNAPTLQMAMKWLREKHNIHIEIGYNMGYFPVCISTKTNDTIPYIAMGSPFTYEKACEVAIKYCLEYLI